MRERERVYDRAGGHQITVDVAACPRCAQQHRKLVFRKFTKRPVVVYEADDPVLIEYYAACPRLDEPILLREPSAKLKEA